MKNRKGIKLIIDDIPPSNNVFLGKKGTNWKYSSLKKKWAKTIQAELLHLDSFLNLDKPFEKATVSIHYVFPDRRRRDPDNYSGKMLLDPLVTYGVIEDDTFNHIKLELSAEVKPKIRKTIIEVTNEKSQ